MSMTKKQSIDYLKDLWNEVYNEDSDGYNYAEAIDMAIEALQFQDIMINNPLTVKPTPEVCKNCQKNNTPNCGVRMKDGDIV